MVVEVADGYGVSGLSAFENSQNVKMIPRRIVLPERRLQWNLGMSP
jgi:hypothetical protein